jgi:hypothetical protein
VALAGQPDRADFIVRGLALGGLAGLVSGAVAGAGARLAMRLFAVAIDQPTAFTVSGTMVIVTFGLIVGPAAAVGYVALRRVLPGPWPIRGLAYGALLAAFVLASFSANGAGEALPDSVLGTALFAALALVIGVVSAGATWWLDSRVALPTAKPSGLVVVGALIGVVGALMLGSILLSVASGLVS